MSSVTDALAMKSIVISVNEADGTKVAIAKECGLKIEQFSPSEKKMKKKLGSCKVRECEENDDL